MQITAVVEGQGEVAAVPLLLRRMINEIAPNCWVELPRPDRDSSVVLAKREFEAWFLAADQAALAAKFDLTMARANSPSFDKLWRDVERLLRRSPTR